MSGLFQNDHFIVAGRHICAAHSHHLSDKVAAERMRNACKCDAHIELRRQRRKNVEAYGRRTGHRTGALDILSYEHAEGLLAALVGES